MNIKRFRFFVFFLSIASLDRLLLSSDSSDSPEGGYARAAAIGTGILGAGLGVKYLDDAITQDTVAMRTLEVNKMLDKVKAIEKGLHDEPSLSEIKLLNPGFSGLPYNKDELLQSLAKLKSDLEKTYSYLSPLKWDLERTYSYLSPLLYTDDDFKELMLQFWIRYMGILARYDMRKNALEYLKKPSSQKIIELEESLILPSSGSGSFDTN